MSRSESWKAWLGILAILIFSGLMAAFWPAISENMLSSMGSFSGAGSSMDTVTLPIPFIEGGVTLPSVLVLLGLSFLIGGAIVTTGIAIAIGNLLLSRWVTRVETSDDYLEGTAALEKRGTDELTAKQEAQPTHPSQQNDYSRWSVLATSLVMLFFAIVLGYLFGSTLYPSGEIVNEDTIVNITGIITGAFFLVTLLYLVLRLDKDRIAEINANENAGIPWDAVVVILIGAIILGLGIGFIVYLNAPT